MIKIVKFAKNMITSIFPATLNTLTSKTSSERLKLTTQIYHIQKKFWQALSKLSIKVSDGLNTDLISVIVSDFISFIKFS